MDPIGPWTCAKCKTTVDGDRSICRACGAGRARGDDAHEPEAPSPTAVEAQREVARPPDEQDAPDAPAEGATDAAPWTCAKCRTVVEGDFEVCWQCGTSSLGAENPDFRPTEGAGSDPELPGAGPARTCPACGAPLVPIQLIDTSGQYGLRHGELKYAAGDARPGLFLGYPIEGVIRAQRCPRCGRVELYAVPTERA